MGVLVVVIAVGGWFLVSSQKDGPKEEQKNIAYIALGESNKIGLFDMDGNILLSTVAASNNPHGVAVANGYIFTSSTKMGPKEMAMAPKAGMEGKSDMPMSEMTEGNMNNKMKDDMKGGMDGEMGAGNSDSEKDSAMKKVGSDIIAVISQKTGEIVKEINLGGGSHHGASSPDGTKVAVTVPSQNGVAIIDTEKLEKVSFVETGKVSNYAVFSEDSTMLFVTNSSGNTLSVVDLKDNTVTNILVGTLPDHLVAGKGGKFVYTANGGDDKVAVIDLESREVVKTISVGKVPHGITISKDGAKLYVANSNSNTVSIIDVLSGEVVNTIEFTDTVAHLEVTPNGDKLLVNSEEGKKIYVVDTKDDKIVSEVSIGAEPHQIAF